ncbi:Uu.00g006610.m01.CDS01 [Anthostomella pinea]|uniref:Uu.00g006610.m01.CDS01 n=1 Tax=Anthostomella pinea TaxID=933095 RepID=A0AAI8VKC8_9PEZI|nr:Uu.00g006610.m01.CDS01 [Anthostomella pinea]
MATVETSPKVIHTPPGPEVKRPRGILKHSFQKSPPVSPTQEHDMEEKDLTIVNTQANAGHRRSSSAASRPAGSRRQSTRAPSQGPEDDLNNSQRLQWDEANLYLTEQERTSTMKITEPKTPYARHYEPSEDEDDEMLDGEATQREEIPGLSLGEPEEEVPEDGFDWTRKQSKVQVNDEDATPLHDAEKELLGMTPEEREKHRKFELLRKKHYEMKDVAKFLGHPEELDELEEEDDAAPPVPTINGAKVGAGD